MTFERKYFIDFKPVKGRVYLAGKGNILESRGIGSIKVKLRDAKDKITCIMMHDVIYVPELRTNLLSIMKLMERRLKVNFTEYGVKICKENGETIAVGKQIDNHFVMHMIPITESSRYTRGVLTHFFPRNRVFM